MSQSLNHQFQISMTMTTHFEADTQQMYTEIRRSMGRDFPDDFGLEEISEPDKDLRSMESDEYDRFKKPRAEEHHCIFPTLGITPRM